MSLEPPSFSYGECQRKSGLCNQIPTLKKEHPSLNVVHSSPLKNAALRLSASIQDHQKSKKGRRKGIITGWPQFRSWKIREDNLILSLGIYRGGGTVI